MSTALSKLFVLLPGCVAVIFAIAYLVLAPRAEGWAIALFALVSFALYFYFGAGIASLLRGSMTARLISGLSVPVLAAVVLFVCDKASGPPSGGNFITLKFEWPFLWTLPGMFVARTLATSVHDQPLPSTTAISAQPITAVRDLGGVVRVTDALAFPHGETLLVAQIALPGGGIACKLARLTAGNTVDPTFALAGECCDAFDCVAGAHGDAILASWTRPMHSASDVGLLGVDGSRRALFNTTSDAAGIHTIDRVADVRADGRGSFLVAGAFGFYAEQMRHCYPVVRMTTEGQPDRSFRAPPREDRSPAKRLQLAADGSMWVVFGEWIAQPIWHLAADGTRDTHLDSLLPERDQARFSVATMRTDGSLIAAFLTGAPEHAELFRIAADARTMTPFGAPLPAELGEVAEVHAQVGGVLIVTRGPTRQLLHLRDDGARDTAFDAAFADLACDGLELHVLRVAGDGSILLARHRERLGTHLILLSRTGALVREWEL